MNKFLGFAWLIATTTSWISFGVASWEWADNPTNAMMTLTILWFAMSLVLFLIGLRLNKPSS